MHFPRRNDLCLSISCAQNSPKCYELEPQCFIDLDVVIVGSRMKMKSEIRRRIIMNIDSICEKVIDPLIEVGFHVSNEKEYLENFDLAAKGIHPLSLDRNYVLEVEAYLTHKRKWVYYDHKECKERVKIEIGDLLFLSRYKHMRNIVSQRGMITQAKYVHKGKWDVRLNQLSLYYYWLTRRTKITIKKKTLNFKATQHSFSPLLLINTSGTFPNSYGPMNSIFPSNVGIASSIRAYNQLMKKLNVKTGDVCTRMKIDETIDLMPHLSLTTTLWRLLLQFIGEPIEPSKVSSQLIKTIAQNPHSSNNGDKREKPFVTVIFTVTGPEG